MSGGMYVILENDPVPPAPSGPRTPSGSINDPDASSLVHNPYEMAGESNVQQGPGLMLESSDEEQGRGGMPLVPRDSRGASISIMDRIIILNRPATPGNEMGLGVGGGMPL